MAFHRSLRRTVRRGTITMDSHLCCFISSPPLNPTDGRLGLILIGVVVVGAILLWRRGQKPKEEAIRFFQ